MDLILVAMVGLAVVQVVIVFVFYSLVRSLLQPGLDRIEEIIGLIERMEDKMEDKGEGWRLTRIPKDFVFYWADKSVYAAKKIRHHAVKCACGDSDCKAEITLFEHDPEMLVLNFSNKKGEFSSIYLNAGGVMAIIHELRNALDLLYLGKLKNKVGEE